MATTIVISGRTVNAGTINFGPAVVQPAINQIQLVIDTTNMTDPAMSLVLAVEISLDSGVTWQPLISCTRVGAAVPPNDPSTGLPATTAGFMIGLPSGGTGRQLRGSFTWAGPSMVMGDLTLVTS